MLALLAFQEKRERPLLMSVPFCELGVLQEHVHLRTASGRFSEDQV